MAATVTYDGGWADSTFDSTVEGGDAGTFFPIEGPTLTPQPNSEPPSVQIVLDDVDPATAVVTIYRIADGRTTPVRGGIRKYAVGGASVIDWEAPFGVPVTYRVEMFSDPDASEGSSLGFTDASETFLDVKVTWLHQPLLPALCVRALRLMGSANDQVRVTPGDLVYAQGAELATWIGGQRRGLSDSPWDLLVESSAEADKMQAVFGAYGSTRTPVICLRTPPPMRVPRTLYLAVAELHEVDVDIPGGGDAVRFTFNGTEARPPAPGLVAAALRRIDIDATYPTRAERAAAYLTRLGRDSDFSLAGVAGDA
jgi:hypothetical protein